MKRLITVLLWMLKIAVGCMVVVLLVSVLAPEHESFAEDPSLGPHDFYPGDYSEEGIIGQSLPGTWRPFADDSPWNTPIPPSAPKHPDSDIVMVTVEQETDHVSLINTYLTPVWVVNAANMPLPQVRSDRIFDTWDQDRDGWSDVGAPLTPEMWGEPTEDGQICVVDPFRHLLWDISSYGWAGDGEQRYPVGTTFDIWDLKGSGVADPPEGTRWVLRGGRGSGFPALAGMIRPEELELGEIRHALCVSFPQNRRDVPGAQMYLPPASRSDGKYPGARFPIQGMRFQLDPTLTEADFEAWGLNREGKIVARALQTYGMYLGLNGGAMKLQVQLLGQDTLRNRAEWERRFPGFYSNVQRIPVTALKVIDTGFPRVRIWSGTD